MSILELKILSDRTSPFGFFFWELLARVGRDHSTTVLSSAAQVGFKDDPGIKWHLDTEFYLLSASYLAIFFLLVDTVFYRHLKSYGRIRHASSLFVVVAASKNWLRPYFSRKRLSQLVVSQSVFTLLVIMQIIWNLVGKRFRARHRQWLDPHRTFAVGHCQQKRSYSGLRSPGRSNATYLWNGSCWVQIFHKLNLLCDF